MTPPLRTLLVALLTASTLFAAGVPAAPARAAAPPIMVQDGTQLAGAGIGSSRFGRGRGGGFSRPGYGYRRRGVGGHGFFTGFFFGRLFGFPGVFLLMLLLFFLLSRSRRAPR